jgi:hypothetical protein
MLAFEKSAELETRGRKLSDELFRCHICRRSSPHRARSGLARGACARRRNPDNRREPRRGERTRPQPCPREARLVGKHSLNGEMALATILQDEASRSNRSSVRAVPLPPCRELFPARKRILDKVCVVVTGIASDFIA